MFHWLAAVKLHKMLCGSMGNPCACGKAKAIPCELAEQERPARAGKPKLEDGKECGEDGGGVEQGGGRDGAGLLRGGNCGSQILNLFHAFMSACNFAGTCPS